MHGKTKPISLARRAIIDLMHFSVPLVVVHRTLKLERLATARAARAVRPSWATILAKAFSIVARDEPWLRTFYLKWPWQRFYEMPESIGMIAVIHEGYDKEVPIMVKINAPDEFSLENLDALIQHGKTAPLDELDLLKRSLRVTRLPLPLRRLAWAISLNSGRLRANNFGTFWITSIASLGSETVVARMPGPNLMSYGMVRPDHNMELLLHWDHNLYNGIVATRVLQRLEDVLNTDIADELLKSGR